MANLVFSVRKLRISNLSWFKETRNPSQVGEDAGRERAVNINKPVINEWYPEGIPPGLKELLIKNEYVDEVGSNEKIINDINRPIKFQGGESNWRLAGDAIEGDFYGTMRPGDLMFFTFHSNEKKLSWFCIRGNKNNSPYTRPVVPDNENNAYDRISNMLGPYNASKGMWLPDFRTSVRILLELYGVSNLTWELLRSEELIAEHKDAVQGSTSGTEGERRILYLPKNRILYGAPGTGKSKKLENEAKNPGEIFEKIERVTFHPELTYGQFIGNYKPFPVYRKTENEIKDYSKDDLQGENEEPLIDYRLVPGPFLELLVEAIKNRNSYNYLLIIEELNRANVASVFGDVFQLLDREKNADSPFNGGSAYSIILSKDLTTYLNRRLNPDSLSTHEDPFIDEFIREKKIRIPDNMYLWATMNNADQGVLPLDSAFKRRWTFEYLPLNDGSEIVKERKVCLLGNDLYWNDLRECINQFLIINRLNVSEDKLIGPFFMAEDELTDQNIVNNKLLLYLKEDVLRHSSRGYFFNDDISTFSQIIDITTKETSYEEKVKGIFSKEFSEEVLKLKSFSTDESLSQSSSELDVQTGTDSSDASQ